MDVLNPLGRQSAVSRPASDKSSQYYAATSSRGGKIANMTLATNVDGAPILQVLKLLVSTKPSESLVSWASLTSTCVPPLLHTVVVVVDKLDESPESYVVFTPTLSCVSLQLVSVSVDDPLPAIQDVTLNNVVGGTFTLRVMADALGGEIDAETAEIGYSASAAAVELALEAASSTLGGVQVTKTTSGDICFHFHFPLYK